MAQEFWALKASCGKIEILPKDQEAGGTNDPSTGGFFFAGCSQGDAKVALCLQKVPRSVPGTSKLRRSLKSTAGPNILGHLD